MCLVMTVSAVLNSSSEQSATFSTSAGIKQPSKQLQLLYIKQERKQH